MLRQLATAAKRHKAYLVVAALAERAEDMEYVTTFCFDCSGVLSLRQRPAGDDLESVMSNGFEASFGNVAVCSSCDAENTKALEKLTEGVCPTLTLVPFAACPVIIWAPSD